MAQTKPKAGQFYGVSGNGTDGQFLRTDGAGGMSWAAPIVQPTLTSIDYPGTQTAADPAGGESVIIYGTGFATGITCTVGGTSATTTFNSATQITITSPAKTAGQYTVEVTNTDGGTASQANFIQYSGVPIWTTNSGSLGTVEEGGTTSFQVTATEGSDTIEYAVTTGSLPSGLSLATATGAITGTAPSVSADTTSTFSITATDDENQTSSARSFSITVTNIAPSDLFNPVLYVGNKPSNNAITGVGFQPDLVWIKDRSAAENHTLFDSVRGEYALESNTQSAQSDFTGYFSFDSDGFTVGNSGQINSASNNYVAWNWKAGGAAISNPDGTTTSTISLNANAGFSIVKTSAAGGLINVGHGLGADIGLIILKGVDAAETWQVWHKDVGTGKYLQLASSDGATTRAASFSTVNSTIFENNWTGGAVTWIAYCWKSIPDFSKIGTFTGNGSASGPFIETGFEPAWVLIKCSSNSGTSWRVMDNKRNPDNPRLSYLEPQSSAAEADYNQVNFYTNGFQLITADTSINGSGRTQIYMAFAADGSTTTPSLANSFQNFTWAGSGSASTKTGLNFQPDAIFWKAYDNASYNWKAVDSVRGKSQNASTYDNLYPNLTNAQNTDNALSAINANSIDFSSGGNGNVSGLNYIGYSWKAGGLPSINTDGTISSIVSANQAAGFSVVTYNDSTGSGTLGHGLNASPQLIIQKALGVAQDWYVYIAPGVIDANYNYLVLNTNAAGGTTGSTAPTSTTFNPVSSGAYVAYCFAPITNFSSIGTYTATGSAGTPTITTGFQPDMVIMKNFDRAQEWVVIDAARGLTQSINTNASSAQYTGNTISTDATSFTIDVSGGGINYASGDTFIYMAFKQN